MNIEKEKRDAKIYELYQSGMTQPEIAKAFGICRTTVIKSLKGKNKREKTWGMQKYKDENPFIFSEIDTEEKAYWFGFLLADGNITYPKSQKGQSRWRLRLFVTESDIDVILKFKAFMGNNRTIERKKNSNSVSKPLAGITINNRQIVDDLISKGCVPDKSLQTNYPYFLIDTEFERHFIRGLFDGDGFITSYKKSGKFIVPVAGFTSGTNSFLVELNERLLTITKSKIVPRKSTGNGGDVRIYSYCNCSPFYDWMYRDATVWLERKRKKYKELLSTQIKAMKGRAK
jgi:intein-encoded DNA endonuclease-like protein